MTERLLMRQVRGILRLKYEQGLPHRAIARACGVGLGTVSEYCRRAQRAALTWPLPADLDDAQLEARLFRRIGDVVGVPRPLPDMAWIHQELKRPGVTLQRLGQAAGDLRRHDGRGPARGIVRRRARREQLRVCRSLSVPGSRRVDHCPRADGRVLRWRAGDLRAR